VRLGRRLRKKPWVQKTIGVLAAEYLRLAWRTSSFAVEPTDLFERYEREQPVIIAFWHGQHFLTPFLAEGYRVKTLISRHGDGELNAIAAARLGIGAVRGSGDHGTRFNLKGGVSAFKTMVDLLGAGWNVGLTADVPKVARVAGLGIIKLAAASGRPIFPICVATNRRIVLNNWDRTEINLPFSRGAVVVGEPIRVAADANARTLERARDTLERALNTATERAHAIADRGLTPVSSHLHRASASDRQSLESS
jgi:lysophospholipid acyltransferase (LPLAT)-like uncharacterized protein